MNKNLLCQAIIKYVLGIVLVSSLLFLPAGSFQYKNAWYFLCILFIPMFFVGIYLMLKNPSLLEKRLHAKESEKEQKQVVIYSGFMFIVGFVIAGLDYRYHLTSVPDYLVLGSSVLFIVGYLLYMEVLKENTFLSRTIEVQKEQKVIDTGLYKIVRHPMYASTILLFLNIPLILDSFLSFLVFLIYPFLIVKRIHNEEMVLEKELPDYKNYQKKVKYKLIPFIW